MTVEKNQSMLADIRDGCYLTGAEEEAYGNRVQNLRSRHPNMPSNELFKQALTDVIEHRNPAHRLPHIRVGHEVR